MRAVYLREELIVFSSLLGFTTGLILEHCAPNLTLFLIPFLTSGATHHYPLLLNDDQHPHDPRSIKQQMIGSFFASTVAGPIAYLGYNPFCSGKLKSLIMRNTLTLRYD